MKKDAIERLCKDLGLPSGDTFTQDWAYELPEECRSAAHLTQYRDAYWNPQYGDDERIVLMELMLDLCNDLYEGEAGTVQMVWPDLMSMIRRRPDLHRSQLEYWAVPGEPIEDAFSIASWAREALSVMECRG